MTLTEIIGYISLAFIILVTLLNAFQAVYLFAPFFLKPKPHKPEKTHRFAIMIAARNEEKVIAHLLDSINAQDYPRELVDIFVVADNCTDRTASISAAHGAHVYERFNKEQVGKGYALNFLLEQIRRDYGFDAFDQYMIFDADNLLCPDYLTQMNKVCSDGFDAYCGYRNTKNLGDNWISAFHGMWYLHDSVHLNQSRMLLGTNCFVTGTGFGFTKELLKVMDGWHFFTLTEDVEFSTFCATHGYRIGYCHEAMLFDEQPTQFRLSWRQRTRWTQGGIQVTIRHAKSYFQGMAKGGRTGYASFEATMLSMWGYVVGILAMAFGLTSTILTAGWMGIVWMAIGGIGGMYLGLLLVGMLTIITEWHHLRATTGQKLMAMFASPMYMITYVPIAITSIFRKFSWPPIDHTVAVSVETLTKK